LACGLVQVLLNSRHTLRAVVEGLTEMNGAGNDFVLIDNRAQKIKLSRAQIVRLLRPSPVGSAPMGS